MSFRRAIAGLLVSGATLGLSGCLQSFESLDKLSSTAVSVSSTTLPAPGGTVAAAAFCDSVSTPQSQAFSTALECQTAFPTATCVYRIYPNNGQPRACYVVDGAAFSGAGSVSLQIPSAQRSGNFVTGGTDTLTLTLTNVSDKAARNCQAFPTNPGFVTISPSYVSSIAANGGTQTFSVKVIPFSGPVRTTLLEFLCENGFVFSGVYTGNFVSLYRTLNASTNFHKTSQSELGEADYQPDLALGRPFATDSPAADPDPTHFAQICRCDSSSGSSFTTTDATCPNAGGWTRTCFTLNGAPLYVHTEAGHTSHPIPGEMPIYRMYAPYRGNDYMDSTDPNEGVTGFFQIADQNNICLMAEGPEGKMVSGGCTPNPTDKELWKPVPDGSNVRYVSKLNPNQRLKPYPMVSQDSLGSYGMIKPQLDPGWSFQFDSFYPLQLTSSNPFSDLWTEVPLADGKYQLKWTAGTGRCVQSFLSLHSRRCNPILSYLPDDCYPWEDHSWPFVVMNTCVNSADPFYNSQVFKKRPELYQMMNLIGYIMPP